MNVTIIVRQVDAFIVAIGLNEMARFITLMQMVSCAKIMQLRSEPIITILMQVVNWFVTNILPIGVLSIRQIRKVD